jgi:hypothetical protein
MKKTIMALFMTSLMVMIIFGTLPASVSSISKLSLNTVSHVHQNNNDLENKMLIQDFKKLSYEELAKIDDIELRLQLLSELDYAFSKFRDIGVVSDMTVAETVELVDSKINGMPLKKATNPIFYPTPRVIYGPFMFISIDADFSNSEGNIIKEGRRLRVNFTPSDVTSEDSYVKIKGLSGVYLKFPYNTPDYPVQNFDTFIRIFFGSATSSNGRVIVKGFCIYTIIFAEWHRH